jgi:hypothetical protein
VRSVRCGLLFSVVFVRFCSVWCSGVANFVRCAVLVRIRKFWAML